MATENRAKVVKIQDPKAFFAEWNFGIKPHHYEPLGLGFKEFIKDKKPSWSWAMMEPVEYWFEVGYVFCHTQNAAHFLQVAARWDALHFEVHEGFVGVERGRSAFAVTERDLSIWLRTGVRPPGMRRLDFPSSKAGLMAWQIANETGVNERSEKPTQED